MAELTDSKHAFFNASGEFLLDSVFDVLASQCLVLSEDLKYLRTLYKSRQA